MPNAHSYTLHPFRGVLCHVRVNVFSPPIYCSMSIIHARFSWAHQLNVHGFVLWVLRKRLIVVAPETVQVITYPFHPVQVIITDMVFGLPTILDNVLSRERRLRSMPPEELPELLTFVVRYDGLNLIKIKP